MQVKELMTMLKKCKKNAEVVFYHLHDHELINCELESVLNLEERAEITITEMEE